MDWKGEVIRQGDRQGRLSCSLFPDEEESLGVWLSSLPPSKEVLANSNLSETTNNILGGLRSIFLSEWDSETQKNSPRLGIFSCLIIRGISMGQSSIVKGFCFLDFSNKRKAHIFPFGRTTLVRLNPYILKK